MGAPGAGGEAAVRELRGLAHRWVDGQYGDPAELVEAAVRALVAGVDTPSLPLLAGLLRAELDQVPELFHRVMDELGFGFRPPEDYWQGRLALARWYAAEVVGGWLDPWDGAELVIENVAEAYGECAELAPMVEAVRALQDPGGPGRPADARDHLTRAARELLARIPS
ncbi:hypothetical protein KCH_63240 [Kitasatospora cheerisanensis KCTC 2395]|uniref:Uncharacterized protein n=1 Tax=Kitasatospora cheerisanensis KCTC 2395 TaxID=1348663 RepID=A0A066YVD0_9ACTN|nr:hypothetical protein KCH_63240 [Kitasatospora cheerisanensis KCTC 2395]